MEYYTGRHATMFNIFLVVGPLFVCTPLYYALYLHKYFIRKTGEVLDDPEALREGEELGEELSELDTPTMQRTLGFFYKAVSRKPLTSPRRENSALTPAFAVAAPAPPHTTTSRSACPVAQPPHTPHASILVVREEVLLF